MTEKGGDGGTPSLTTNKTSNGIRVMDLSLKRP